MPILSIAPSTCSPIFSECFISLNAWQYYKQRGTQQSLHSIILILIFYFMFFHLKIAYFRLILYNWFKLSSGWWQRLVSSRHPNAPPTQSKVFSFKPIAFFSILYFWFLYFILITLMKIFLHHISLSCSCNNLLPRFPFFSESN